MTDILYDEIELGWELLNKGKLEEGLQIVIEFEKHEDLTPEEKLRSQILKGILLFNSGEVDKAFSIGKHAEKEGVRLGKPLMSMQAIILIKFPVLFIKRSNTKNELISSENLFESALQEPSTEIEQGEVLLNYIRGYYKFWQWELDTALDYFKKCLVLFERSTHLSYMMQNILNVMGASYLIKGELEQALNYLKRCFEYSNGTYMSKRFDAANYQWIGGIYHQQGEIDLAIDYYKKSLNIWEEFNESHPTPNSVDWIGKAYNLIIHAFLDKGSCEEAENYLQNFELFLDKFKLYSVSNTFKLSKARILKLSPRTRDRAKAEKILLGIIDTFDSVGWKSDEYNESIVELCGFYLEELYSTHELKVLNDILPLIDRLRKHSEHTSSFLLLARTHLLQGKVSLLQMNFGDARRYLTQAQDIAEEHGLQLLAQSISKEHDKLLEQLKKIENTGKLDVNFSERLDLASIDEIIARMQGKRAITVPELVNEEPILLLIITEGGVPIFSYPFTDDWNREDELFASFMSAITSFSSELFSEGLDRVKFGQYTVLMKPMAELSSCYLFKGQTYLAKQKLARFTDGIQNNTSIMQTLNKYCQVSQVVELKDFPFLEVFIKDVFGTN